MTPPTRTMRQWQDACSRRLTDPPAVKTMSEHPWQELLRLSSALALDGVLLAMMRMTSTLPSPSRCWHVREEVGHYACDGLDSLLILQQLTHDPVSSTKSLSGTMRTPASPLRPTQKPTAATLLVLLEAPPNNLPNQLCSPNSSDLPPISSRHCRSRTLATKERKKKNGSSSTFKTPPSSTARS